MANAGSFRKGEKRPGQGRPKGSTNKDAGLIREMVATALDKAGGVDYLVERAKDPKTAGAFLSLVGKTMPIQVQGTDGGAVKHSLTIEFVKPAK